MQIGHGRDRRPLIWELPKMGRRLDIPKVPHSLFWAHQKGTRNSWKLPFDSSQNEKPLPTKKELGAKRPWPQILSWNAYFHLVT